MMKEGERKGDIEFGRFTRGIKIKEFYYRNGDGKEYTK